LRTIRASEIGTFIYCQRAWRLQQRGEPNQNQVELASGAAIHEKHGQVVLVTGCLRILAFGIIFLALALLAYSLTIRFL
jgi:hypothetical protein